MRPEPPFSLLAVHAGATLFMTGLIWFVQVIHYPLFAAVGADGFAAYEQLHTTRTTWVVAPVMLTEVGAALLLFRHRARRGILMSGAALLAVIWMSTFLLQVPRHEILAGGFDEAVLGGLVGTNWIRTAAWSGRSILALGLLKPLRPSD